MATTLPAPIAARIPMPDLESEEFKPLATDLQLDKSKWRAIVNTVFPAAKDLGTVIAALDYCRSRNLDPFKRMCHIVPMWSSEKNGYIDQIWGSIAELRATASRTGQYAGRKPVEWGPMKTRSFDMKTWEGPQGRRNEVTKQVEVTYPEWARVTVMKKIGGHAFEFAGPEVYWEETYASIGKTDCPNNMWQERPRGQLEKCAEAAALRAAFPEELGNDYTVEEMEGQEIVHHHLDLTPNTAAPAAPPPVKGEAKAEAKTEAPKAEAKAEEVKKGEEKGFPGDIPAKDVKGPTAKEAKNGNGKNGNGKVANERSIGQDGHEVNRPVDVVDPQTGEITSKPAQPTHSRLGQLILDEVRNAGNPEEIGEVLGLYDGMVTGGKLSKFDISEIKKAAEKGGFKFE